MENRTQKIKKLAELIEKESKEYLIKRDLGCECNLQNVETRVIEGKKYTKIDIKTSGKYMIDAEGNIYGIKAYGVIHRGHRYGNLDTIEDYFWGGYTAIKKVV